MDDKAPAFLDDHYFNVPNEWLPYLGKLAVLSGRIETSAYYIAGLLGIDRPKKNRTPAFWKECKDIGDRLKDSSFPQYIDTGLPGWRESTADWARRAPGVLDRTRNLYLHSNYVHGWVDGVLVPVMQNKIDPVAPHRTVTLQDVAAAVDELVRIHLEGQRRWTQLQEYMQELAGITSRPPASKPGDEAP